MQYLLTLVMNKFYRSSLNSVFSHKEYRDKRCHPLRMHMKCTKRYHILEEFLHGGKGNSTLTKVECDRMTLVVKLEGA